MSNGRNGVFRNEKGEYVWDSTRFYNQDPKCWTVGWDYPGCVLAANLILGHRLKVLFHAFQIRGDEIIQFGFGIGSAEWPTKERDRKG